MYLLRMLVVIFNHLDSAIRIYPPFHYSFFHFPGTRDRFEARPALRPLLLVMILGFASASLRLFGFRFLFLLLSSAFSALCSSPSCSSCSSLIFSAAIRLTSSKENKTILIRIPTGSRFIG